MVSELFPSQQAVADGIVERILENPEELQILYGLSGQGKSAISEDIARILGTEMLSPFNGMVSECRDGLDGKLLVFEDAPHTQILKSIGEARSSIAGMVLHTNRLKEELNNGIANGQLSPTPVEHSIPGLSAEEMRTFVTGICQDVTDAEMDLIVQYSCGIPEMAERFLRCRPLTDLSVLDACAGGLKQMLLYKQFALHDASAVNAVLQEHTGQTFPERLFTEAVLLQETPEDTATSDMRTIVEAATRYLDTARPLCNETIAKLTAWIDDYHKSNDTTNLLNIFVPHATAEQQFLLCKDIGLQQHYPSGSPISCVGHGYKKMYAYGDGVSIVDEVSDTREAIQHREAFFSAQGIPLEITSREHWQCMFIYKSPHHGNIESSVAAAYVFETFLQHANVPYQIHRGNRDLVGYDPAANAYTTIGSYKREGGKGVQLEYFE